MANNSQFTGMQPIQPPPVASLGPSLNPIPTRPLHYRPVVQLQQPPSYLPLAQFQHMGNPNVVMPHPPPPHPSQQMYQQPRPHIPIGQAHAIPVPDYQQNAAAAVAIPQPQPNVPVPNTYMPGFGGPQMPPSVPQNSWSSTADQSMKPVTPLQQSAEAYPAAPNQDITPKHIPKVDSPLLWIIHTARNGKRYYYNRLTKLSTWEKPLDLMTVIERADATTDWREYISPDGRKYFYNRVTKQSKWRMPDEVKVARERVNPESLNEPEPKAIIYQRPSALPTSEVNASSSSAEAPNSQSQPEPSSPVPEAPPIVADQSVAAPVVSTSPSVVSPVTSDAIEMQTSVKPSDPVIVSEKDPVSSALATDNSNPVSPVVPDPVVVASAAGASPGKNEEVKNIKDNAQSDEKAIDQGPLVYENKQDAKNAFKELLESTNVGSDWIWDQAMKAIINDKRYGALKSLGERKQVFNEFVSQKKKQEVEEKRVRQKQAREDFKNMLEESKELTSSTRWSKAQSMFQDDERFRVVEKSKDREDLFMDYLEELEKKDRVKAMEDYKRIKAEYLEFLKSCQFIQASSQWRRVQDRLEADERCSRLEKIDRLEIFQEYIRVLEKEEEELMRLQMEEQRKVERKNRDEFRKLMEEHIISGLLTGKTIWRDYSLKVKDLPAFHALSSNSSGPSAKDLFEDVFEELEKRYLDDKARIRDAINIGEVTVTSNSTLDEFKDAISKDLSSPVSDYNLKLVFDELYERAREKEEREAKKRKRLTDELNIFLLSSKDITSSSRWEDSKQLIEERFVADTGFLQEVFDKFISDLKAKEKERRRREDKERRDKERKRSRKDREKGGESRNKEKGGESSRKRKERSRSGTESDPKEKGDESSRKRKEKSRSGTESDPNKEKGDESRKRKEKSRSGTESDPNKEKGDESSRKRKEKSRSGTESDPNKEKGGESRKRKERSRSGTESSDPKEKGGESKKRKEKSRSGTESDRVDSHRSSRRSGRDKKDRKHRRRHSSSHEETHVDDSKDRERSRKKSHRHSSDYKKKRV